MEGEALSLDRAVSAVSCAESGAVATFQGVVRDNSDGRGTDHLEYEAYAERCHGAKFDLGGDVGELTLGPRGHVAAGRHDEGNFKAWASTRKA